MTKWALFMLCVANKLCCMSYLEQALNDPTAFKEATESISYWAFKVERRYTATNKDGQNVEVMRNDINDPHSRGYIQMGDDIRWLSDLTVYNMIKKLYKEQRGH